MAKGGQGGPPARAASGSGPSRPNLAQAPPTETIRLLGLRSVQTDLAITPAEYAALDAIARSLRGTTSEEAALASVSKALTPAQIVRLKELLVQDMGYLSLALADVRAALGLTAEQSSQIASALSTLVTAKNALENSTDPRASRRAIAALETQASAALAKLLTPEQDAKLRSLGGRALGAK